IRIVTRLANRDRNIAPWPAELALATPFLASYTLLTLGGTYLACMIHVPGSEENSPGRQRDPEKGMAIMQRWALHRLGVEESAGRAGSSLSGFGSRPPFCPPSRSTCARRLEA
ncbi:MAG: hypothetical protein WBP10_16850, partial [Thermoanaerobaculia bacterium]